MSRRRCVLSEIAQTNGLSLEKKQIPRDLNLSLCVVVVVLPLYCCFDVSLLCDLKFTKEPQAPNVRFVLMEGDTKWKILIFLMRIVCFNHTLVEVSGVSPFAFRHFFVPLLLNRGVKCARGAATCLERRLADLQRDRTLKAEWGCWNWGQ